MLRVAALLLMFLPGCHQTEGGPGWMYEELEPLLNMGPDRRSYARVDHMFAFIHLTTVLWESKIAAGGSPGMKGSEGLLTTRDDWERARRIVETDVMAGGYPAYLQGKWTPDRMQVRDLEAPLREVLDRDEFKVQTELGGVLRHPVVRRLSVKSPILGSILAWRRLDEPGGESAPLEVDLSLRSTGTDPRSVYLCFKVHKKRILCRGGVGG